MTSPANYPPNDARSGSAGRLRDNYGHKKSFADPAEVQRHRWPLLARLTAFFRRSR